MGLLALLARVPDPRSRHGWRYPLAALLGMTVEAVLSGARTYAEVAEPGAVVVTGLRLGGVWVLFPCRVVWTVDEADRGGFADGTLPGHPESGEEAFVVERDEAGAVWRLARLVRPLARRQQSRGHREVPAGAHGAVIRRASALPRVFRGRLSRS